MTIIPAIDIIENKLVRLEKGNYQSTKVYAENPIDYVKKFSDMGFKRLHMVDLTGSKTGEISVFDLIKKIKAETNIKIQFGGGIRTINDARNLIDSGIDKLVIGSISILNKKEFEKIIQYLGPKKIICAVDVIDNMIMIKGWTNNSNILLNDHLNYCLSLKVNTFLCTDINRDGMLKGPNTILYKKLVDDFPSANIIASGGVSSLEDLNRLQKLNLYAVVVGKAIYENKIDLKEISKIVS